MVNILVPTDFSPLSKIAVKFAVRIANKLAGNVTLLHVIDLTGSIKAGLQLKNSSRKLLSPVRENLEQLKDEAALMARFRKPIAIKMSQGATFSETIVKESKRLRSGLIVMGTRGASGLKKAVLGSNTVSVISRTNIPVLVVPEHAEFKSTFRNIIYATDLKHLERELEILVKYAEPFGSTIHILHIMENGDQLDAVEERIDGLVKQRGYRNIVTLVTVNQDVDGAIEHYISVSKADLLAMFTHTPSFFEKVFDRSITRKMAFQSTIPLLAFKNNF